MDNCKDAFQKMSLLAQFDNVCRTFDTQGCDDEFLSFVWSQNDCLHRWKAAEEEIFQINKEISEVSKLNSKLELKNHHAAMLLKEEVKNRTKAQEEKHKIEKQLSQVRDFLQEQPDIQSSFKEKLNFLGPRHSLNTVKTNPNPYHLHTVDKLETICEVNSSISCEPSPNVSQKSEEELELSEIRSYRKIGKQSRVSGRNDYQQIMKPSPAHNNHNSAQFEAFGDDCLVATTRVTMSPEGTAVATSTIESRPINEQKRMDVCQTSRKKHVYKRQLIIHQSENCVPCGIRIKFGKPALKCTNCDKACHVDCEVRMPESCSSERSASNDLKTSAQKTKKTLRFFSPPSEKY